MNQTPSLDQELMDAYFEELEIALNAITCFEKQDVTENSLNSLKIQIHKIKGNASMLELNDFSAVLEWLETHIIECLNSNPILEVKSELIVEAGKICKAMIVGQTTSNDSVNEMILNLKTKMNY